MGRFISLSIIVAAIALNMAAGEEMPSFPERLQDLNGLWTWDWGHGKFGFVLDNGRIRGQDWKFELASPLLKVNIDKTYSTDLSLQPDGSWQGIQYPGKETIKMRRVDPQTLTIPKDIAELDGKWTWQWNNGVGAFDVKNGKRLDDSGWRFKIDGCTLRVTLNKSKYANLVLQPDGSWIGLEAPTKYIITMKRAK